MSPKPIGGPYITGTTILAAIMVSIMAILVLIRFCFGLGTVTNLNDGYSWGLWLAYDVVAGTAIGCGGYPFALEQLAKEYVLRGQGQDPGWVPHFFRVGGEG